MKTPRESRFDGAKINPRRIFVSQEDQHLFCTVYQDGMAIERKPVMNGHSFHCISYSELQKALENNDGLICPYDLLSLAHQ